MSSILTPNFEREGFCLLLSCVYDLWMTENQFMTINLSFYVSSSWEENFLTCQFVPPIYVASYELIIGFLPLFLSPSASRLVSFVGGKIFRAFTIPFIQIIGIYDENSKSTIGRCLELVGTKSELSWLENFEY